MGHVAAGALGFSAIPGIAPARQQPAGRALAHDYRAVGIARRSRGAPLGAAKKEFFHEAAAQTRTEAYVWIRVSNLQEKLFDFLAFVEARQDVGGQGKYLLQAFRGRGWEKHLESTYKEANAWAYRTCCDWQKKCLTCIAEKRPKRVCKAFKRCWRGAKR